MSINGHKVPDESLRSFFSKSVKKGVFNLLYTLLMLRPCFGCFNPELVETFKKGGDGKFSATELTVDSNFIGSSQSGRTYAGCVRSKRCSILADSRVSDTCRACSNLRNIVINRSVLTSPGKTSFLIKFFILIFALPVFKFPSLYRSCFVSFRIPKFTNRRITAAATANSVERLEGGGDECERVHLPLSAATVLQHVPASSGTVDQWIPTYKLPMGTFSNSAILFYVTF